MKYIFITILILCGLAPDAAAKSYYKKVVVERQLAPGATYTEYRMGPGSKKRAVHVVEIDLVNAYLSVGVLKAGESNRALAKLHEIVRYFDSLNNYKVLAAVNANFWRAYGNYPIGPTVAGGEVIEMGSYKEWSAVFFDTLSRPYFSNFKMTGFVIAKNGDTLHLASVNRRRDTADRCLYNRFAGDTIPRIRGSDIRDKLAEALADTSYRDITDMELDTAALRDEIIKIERESSAEFANAKARLIYIDRPGVNKRIRCRVAKIDTGSHSTEGGCLISAGASGFPAAMLAPGDTVIVEFRTNELSNIEFRESVCGTPRLVRNGRAEHEAQTEGSTGRRFIRHALPRSAIGANRARSKIYLVAVEGNSRSRQTRGASLADMARIMHALGAYDAINLDGGGSTSMVIDNKNVASPLRPDAGRSISVGLGLILRNPPNLKNFFQK